MSYFEEFGSAIDEFRRSKRHPPTEKQLGKVGRFAPPPSFSVGFRVGGCRLDPQRRRFQNRFRKHKKLRTSGAFVGRDYILGTRGGGMRRFCALDLLQWGFQAIKVAAAWL